jgi:outer membrane immunogenic protein
MGAWVGGLEIDISATGIKGSTTSANVSGDLIETNTDRFDTLGSARARVGYLAWPNVLFYGTGGLAWARVNQSVWDNPTLGTVNGSATPAWEFGWVAGAGAETRLWDTNWLWRVEYLHYDFGDSGSTVDSQVGSGTGPGTTSASSLTGHLTTEVVRSGFSYKLN